MNKRTLIMGENDATVVSYIQSILVNGRRVHSRVLSGVEMFIKFNLLQISRKQSTIIKSNYYFQIKLSILLV